MATAKKPTISVKGQLAIPKSVRERLNLKPGMNVSIEVQGESLVMKRLVLEHPDWRTMRGMAKGEDRRIDERTRGELGRGRA